MKHPFKYAVCLALTAIMLTHGSAVRASDDGDLQKGYALAREVCAACHSVEADENAPELIAPSFTQIANSHGISPTALAVILQTPHETMPDLVLRGDDLRGIITYIMSLKKN